MTPFNEQADERTLFGVNGRGKAPVTAKDHQPTASPRKTLRSTRLGATVAHLGWASSGGAVSKLATLLTTVAGARVLGPSWFGVYASLHASADLSAGCLDFGVSQLLSRELASGRLSAAEAIKQALRLRAKTFAGWLLIFVIGVAVATRNEKMPVGVILTFGVASLCIAAYLIPLAILRGALEFRGYAFSLAWGRWLTASIALAALLSNGMLSGLETFAWATLLGEGLTLCLASSMAWRAEIRQSRFMQVNNALLSLREAVPFAAIGIINLLYNRFDIVILGGLSSMREVSQYAPASRIQDLLMMVPSTLGLVVFSVVSTDWCMPGGPERVKKLVEQAAIIGFLASVPFTIAGFAVAARLVPLILGSAYSGSVTPTRVIICFFPAAIFAAPLTWGLAAIGRNTDTVKIFALTGAVAVALHLLLDRRYGAIGGAIASFVREPAALILAIILATRAGIVDLRPATALLAARSRLRRMGSACR